MRIKTLRLENFQGLKAAAFDFDGQSASIFGENGTGKTTVFNAVTWLLFDKPSTGAKSYTPKTKGPVGDLHYLDHTAEAQFIMDDGRHVMLKKVFHENYKKKRGSATEEFDGHSVDFYIDGVPVKEKEYTASLLAFCGGAEKMKILTMPHYFPETMPWEDRRKILLDVCGDISDEDVIASKKELAELPTYLLMPGTTNQHYTVEEYKKIATTQKTNINRQLQTIPGRIDEAQRAIPEGSTDTAAIDGRLKELKARQEELMSQKAAVLAGDTATADARKRTAEAEAAIAEARSAYLSRSEQENQGIMEAINAIRYRINAVRVDQEKMEAEADRYRRIAERMEAQRNDLLQEYAAVQAEAWDEGQAVCPTCHRELPEEEIAKMRESFNLKKSSRLQAINQQGQQEASKTKIEEARAKAVQFQTKADMAASEYKSLSEERDSLFAKVKSPAPFESTEEYKHLSNVAENARVEEASAGKDTSAALEAVNAAIQAVYDDARRLQQQRGQMEQAAAQQRRVEELKAQEREMSAQYEELEKGVYICDLFTKEKVSLLTDRINSKFQNVRFRLFQEQQNGGVKEDCEVLVPSDNGAMVPYRDANNAACINAGLEIIEALSNHWHISMPVFIDNAESVTHLANTTMQIVRLVVSEQDKELRLVLGEERRVSE